MDAQPQPPPSAEPTTAAVIDYAIPRDGKPSRRGRGAVAVCAGLVLPGLGHVIAGRWRRGLGWFAAAVIVGGVSLVALSVPRLVPALAVLLPLTVLLQLASAVDGYRVGRGGAYPWLPGPASRYLAAAVFGTVAVFANPALLPATYVRTHFAEAFTMPGVSMAPTLVPGDLFIAHKREPLRRFSLVAVETVGPQGGKYVDRVVGFPGESVEIADGSVWVDGVRQPNPPGVAGYVVHRSMARAKPGQPVRLGPDEYFFLGDNSQFANDSRFWPDAVPGHQPGTLPRSHIIGRITTVYWPPSRWRQFED